MPARISGLAPWAQPYEALHHRLFLRIVSGLVLCAAVPRRLALQARDILAAHLAGAPWDIASDKRCVLSPGSGSRETAMDACRSWRGPYRGRETPLVGAAHTS